MLADLLPHGSDCATFVTSRATALVINAYAIAHKMDDTWRVLEALGAGPALPNRFNPLERLLESAVQSARLKSTTEVQISGILAFCEEMQRILKIAFIGTFGGRRI